MATSGQLLAVTFGGAATAIGGNTAGSASVSGGALVGINTVAFGYAFNGATFDALRTPTKLKTVTATAAGNTALWTPAAGKKFRLMRLIVMVTANASFAVAGLEEVTLQDSATDVGFGVSFFVPGAAGALVGEQNSGWLDLGNGFLSSTANNVLNVNLGTALATGEIRVFAVGTEE